MKGPPTSFVLWLSCLETDGMVRVCWSSVALMGEECGGERVAEKQEVTPRHEPAVSAKLLEG